MVIHNPLFLTASDLVAKVEAKTGVVVVLKVDGGEGKLWDFAEIDEEQATVANVESGLLHPTVVLSGTFWIISMLSYIGGKW